MKLWIVCLAMSLASGVYSDCSIKNLIDSQTITLKPSDKDNGNQYVLDKDGDVDRIQVASKYVGTDQVNIFMINMRDYHENEPSHENIRILDYSVKLFCKNGVEAQITDLKIGLEFSNIYQPELQAPWSENIIEYILPMPFPPIDLALLQDIIIKDIDIYNSDISVSSDNVQIIAAATAVDDGGKKKTFSVSLTPRSSITKPVDFTLTVTDKPYHDGVDSKSISITVTIKKDETTSLIAFSEINYYADYEVDNPESFTTTATINDKDVEVTISGNAADECFKVANNDGQVTISGKACTKYYGKSIVKLILEAKKYDTIATASLMLNIVSKHFAEDVYVEEYQTEPFAVDIILLDGSADLKIESKPNELDCTFTNSCKDKECPIRCTFPGGFDGPFKQYEVAASKKDTPASKVSTTVIIHSTPDSPVVKFTEPFYKGTIDHDGNILLSPAIETVDACTDMDLQLKDDDRFTIKCAGNTITISVKAGFQPSTDKNIILTLTATHEEKKGVAFIVLEVLALVELEMDFKEMKYQGKVSKDLHLTSLTPELDNTPVDENIELTIDKYTEDFDFKWESGQIVATVTRMEPFSDNLHVVVFILTANSTKGEAKTTIILDIEHEDVPAPKPTITFVDYQVAHTRKEEDLNGDWNVIKMVANSTDIKDTITYSIAVTTPPCVTQVHINPTDGQVIVKEDIPVRTHECEIIATGSNSNIDTKVPLVFVIQRNEETPILFTKLAYTGKLQTKDNSISLEDDLIGITSGQTGINVTIDTNDPNESKFEVQIVQQDKNFALVVKPGADFSDQNIIALVLHASNGESKGYTTISLEIVQEPADDDDTIKFEDYIVAYIKNAEELEGEEQWEVLTMVAKSTDPADTITFFIEVTTPSVTQVQIGVTDGKVIVKKGIPVGTHQCVITATGSHSNAKTETPLVLIIQKGDESPIKYSQLIYTGTLQTSDNKITLANGPIEITSGQEEFSVTIDSNDPNQSKFNVKAIVENKEFELIADPEVDFTSHKIIAVSLYASDGKFNGVAVVYLEIVHDPNEEEETISFKPYQIAHNKVEDDKDWEVLQMVAISTDIQDTINYSIIVKPPSVNEIIIDSKGNVIVKKGIPVGTHECVITATGSHSNINTEAPLVVFIQGAPISFSKLVYNGKLHPSNNKIFLENIVIDSDHREVTVMVHPEDPNKTKFRVEPADDPNEKEFNLVAEDGANFTSVTMVSVAIYATTKNGESEGSVVVSLEVLQVPADDEVIRFNNYEVAQTKMVNEEEDWNVITMEAVSTDTKDKISYSIVVSTPIGIQVDIGKTDGKVVVTKGLPVGTHQCMITATGSHSNMKTDTPLVLIIQNVEKFPITYSELIYNGKLQTSDNAIILTNGPIQISSGPENLDVSIDSNDPNKSKFNVMTDANKEFKLFAAPGAIFTGLKIIAVTLHATDGESNGYAVVSLEIVQTNDAISFNQYKVAHTKMIDDVTNWPVIQMVASSTDAKDNIIYTLTVGDLTAAEVDIDQTNGKVEVKKVIPVGSHECMITAIGSHSNIETQTPLVLIILDKQADYSHIIDEIEEEKDGTVKLPKLPESSEYGYCLEEGYVPEIPELFYIEGHDIKSKMLDREAPEFDEMLRPQFILTVHLILKGGKCPPKNERQKRELNLIEGIAMENKNTLTAPLTTIVTVLIKDVNDNVPQIETNQVHSYPNKDLIAHIRPPFLTTLSATDKDSVESGFGQISYKSLNPIQLVVNAESGEVYPTNAMYDDEDHEYQVEACDHGSPPKCAKATLHVNLLGSNQVATIVVKRNIDELDQLLDEVSKDGVIVRALSVIGYYENTAARMANPFQRTTRDVDVNRKMSAVIYAQDKNGMPMPLESIKELFAKHAAEVIVTDLDESGGDGSGEDGSGGDGSGSSHSGSSDDPDVGLIVAVSILAVLLVGVLIAGAFFYRRLKKSSNPYKTALLNDSTSLSSNKSLEDKTDSKFTSKTTPDGSPDIGARTVSPIPTAPDAEKEESDIQKIEFVKHRGSNASLNRKLERRATGYPLNPPSVDDILEVMENTDNETERSTLPPYRPYNLSAKRDDDLDSIMTDATTDTTKSVKFNNEIVHSVLFEDPHDSEDEI